MKNNTEDWFRANYLDGDEVQDGQMLSSKECLDALTTLTQLHRDELREVYRETQTADLFQGFPIIISVDSDDKDYCDGFSAGVKFLKERIQTLAQTRGIDISDKK